MRLKTPVATALAVATMLPLTSSLAASEPGFVAEPVEPGVERLVSDGAGFDMTTLGDGIHVVFEDIATGLDGDIWVVARRYHTATGRTEGPFAFELGSDGEFGLDVGFPADFEKLVIDGDGTPFVATPVGIRAFDGSGWVDRPGTRAIPAGGGTVWLVEPGDVSRIAPGGVAPGHVLVLGSDLAGYALGEGVGHRFMRDWPSWWESCAATDIGYRNGTGCIDRATDDQRGVGAGHDDESRALFLAGTETGRLARTDDGAIWVLGGPSIEDYWRGQADDEAAIYRIDPAAPGFDCDGC